MRKYIMAVLAVLATVVTAGAEQVFMPYILQVNTADGNAVQYKFADQPAATFADGTMTLKVETGAAVEFAMDDVTSMTLVADEAGVDNVTGDNAALAIAVTSQAITIDGMAAMSPVAVYDMNGRKVAAATSDAEGHATVDVDGLAGGVYVVSTPNHSFKFIK